MDYDTINRSEAKSRTPTANRLSSAGGIAYTWDANGNLLSDGVRTYTYNHANRLKERVEAFVKGVLDERKLTVDE